MNDALSQARAALQQLTPQRRLLLGGVVVGVIGLLLVIGRWATQPDYALLFGNLPAQDAGRVVEQLESEGIKYDLRDGGSSIHVPRSEVYGLRLRLATSGVVTQGPAGYELFDGGTLGMTDFMQKLNVKRALEGELARTIGAIQQVESARVHLVLPERSPFRDQQTSASASVVLAVRGTLAPDQVAGVTGLVAGAVEGMSPNDVTVLDEAGRMLASPQMGAGGDAGLSTSQVLMRQEIERHLSNAGQSMLDQMLGPGKAVVRVAADLDLSRTSTETNSVDPDAQVLISEERQSETGAGAEATSSVRNFEVTRQTQRTEREAGAIQALTVSVLLDEAAPPVEVARPQEEGEDATTPFSEQQLRQIEALVKNAVGFSETRGDRFAVQQIRFQAPEAPEGGFFSGGQGAIWAGLALRYGVLLLALFLGYRVLRRMTDALATPANGSEGEDASSDGETATLPDGTPARRHDGSVGLPDAGQPTTTIEAVSGDPYAAKLSVEASAQLASSPDLIEDVRATVVDSPDAAAAVVRTWLQEDAESVLLP